jgi:hypothetical protein
MHRTFSPPPTALPYPLPELRLPTGFYKAGGAATASQERVQECVEAAKLRSREVRGMLQQALEQADAAAAGAAS